MSKTSLPTGAGGSFGASRNPMRVSGAGQSGRGGCSRYRGGSHRDRDYSLGGGGEEGLELGLLHSMRRPWLLARRSAHVFSNGMKGDLWHVVQAWKIAAGNPLADVILAGEEDGLARVHLVERGNGRAREEGE